MEDTHPIQQLQELYNVAIASTDASSFFIALDLYLEFLYSNPELLKIARTKAKSDTGRADPKRVDYEVRQLLSFGFPWSELTDFHRIAKYYDENARRRADKVERPTVAMKTANDAWYLKDLERVLKENDDDRNAHVTRKKYQPLLTTVHLGIIGNSRMSNRQAGRARVAIIGNVVTIQLPGGENIPISRQLRADLGPYNFMLHILARPGQSISRGEIKSIPGCDKQDNMTEWPRSCGFSRPLKAIFFSGTSGSKVVFHSEVDISAKQAQLIAEHGLTAIGTNRDSEDKK